MLDDALAAFLDAVTEREFDEPLLALVRADGYEDVHLVHGAREFGRDVIGKRDGEQWAWQSKAGDIGQQEWRSLVGQLDELRLVNLGHGSFDSALPRRPVLVTTGRLKGNAPDLYRDYNQRAEELRQPTLGLWDRDILLGMLSGNPDAVLRGSLDGQLLTTLGSIEERLATMSSLEVFARRWAAWEPPRLAALGVIEASLLCDRLVASDRLDLATYVPLCLVANSWAAAAGSPVSAMAAHAGVRMFKTYALRLWAEADERLLTERGLVNFSGGAAWATYPLRCVRIAEILGLLSLLLLDGHAQEPHDPDPDEIAQWLTRFIKAQPGTAHVLSDRYAVSVIPAAMAVARVSQVAAATYLRAVAIWMLNRYEADELGLAGTEARPEEEIARVFGTAFDFTSYDRRPASLLVCVILDLCAELKLSDLYADVYNDLRALRMYPQVLRLSVGADAFLALGELNRIDPNVDYAETLHAGGQAPHHGDEAGLLIVEAGRSWELLAASAALRDRYFHPALKATAAHLPVERMD